MGLYLLIPLSVVLVFIIGVIFWWSVRSGQFDDMEGPAYRMLIDDRDPAPRSDGGKAASPDDHDSAAPVADDQASKSAEKDSSAPRPD